MKTKYVVTIDNGFKPEGPDEVIVIADSVSVGSTGVLAFMDLDPETGAPEFKQLFAPHEWSQMRKEGPYLSEVLGPVIGTLHKLNPLPDGAPDAHGHHEVDL